MNEAMCPQSSQHQGDAITRLRVDRFAPGRGCDSRLPRSDDFQLVDIQPVAPLGSTPPSTAIMLQLSALPNAPDELTEYIALPLVWQDHCSSLQDERQRTVTAITKAVFMLVVPLLILIRYW